MFFLLIHSCVSTGNNFVSGEHTVFANGKEEKDPLIIISLKDSIEENRSVEVEIRSSLIPAMSLLGEMEIFPDIRVIYITQLSFFDNWPNGWTSGSYEASGKITLIQKNDFWFCSIDDELEIWDIVSGQIRYYDTYYRGDQGLRKVRNRVDRLKEVSRYLVEEQKFPGLFGHFKKETTRSPGFTSAVTPFLFPERYGFKKLETLKELAPKFIDSTDPDIQEFSMGAGLRWRVDYSTAVFPENLRELRNSGTLWRDFEEAPELFFSFYNLPAFFTEVLPKGKYIFHLKKE